MKYEIDGKLYEPIKVGDVRDFYDGEDEESCGDCGAEHGQQHYAGCDCERCPVCGLQLISCGHIVYEVEEKNEENQDEAEM